MSRLARVGTGGGLVLLGAAMLVLPGPGLLTIAAGLGILSREYQWARSLLDWMKSRFTGYLPPPDPQDVLAPPVQDGG